MITHHAFRAFVKKYKYLRISQILRQLSHVWSKFARYSLYVVGVGVYLQSL